MSTTKAHNSVLAINYKYYPFFIKKKTVCLQQVCIFVSTTESDIHIFSVIIKGKYWQKVIFMKYFCQIAGAVLVVSAGHGPYWNRLSPFSQLDWWRPSHCQRPWKGQMPWRWEPLTRMSTPSRAALKATSLRPTFWNTSVCRAYTSSWRLTIQPMGSDKNI